MSIETRALHYTYMPGSPFEKQALTDINLTIRDNEFIGLIGHTGSGKSTLIQHFNGLLHPSSGEILVGGLDVNKKETDKQELRRQVGLVFQYPEHQLFEETVERDVAFGPKNLGLSEEEIHERVLEAIHYVGLDEALLKKSPFELSGGQKRRVAIAGVLAMRPKVLILDEPTAGLDPAGRDEILTQVRALYLAHKMTVILVSHSMEDIAKLATRVIVMHKGRVAMDGTVPEVFARAAELRQMGLDVPQVTRLAEEMAKRGMPIGDGIYTVERAKSAILMQLGLLKNQKGKEGAGK